MLKIHSFEVLVFNLAKEGIVDFPKVKYNNYYPKGWVEIKYMSSKRKADAAKIKRILEKRGYKDGEPPRGWDVHHIKRIVDGGKDIPSNIRVIPKQKHKQIHKNRKERGEE